VAGAQDDSAADEVAAEAVTDGEVVADRAKVCGDAVAVAVAVVVAEATTLDLTALDLTTPPSTQAWARWAVGGCVVGAGAGPDRFEVVVDGHGVCLDEPMVGS